MSTNIFKNIRLTTQFDEANCVTHSGKFHVDDIMATIFLRHIYDKIVLIRVPSLENKIVNDKLVYDIGFGKYDHHQNNKNGKRNNGIYYSSIGLLWKDFGRNYLKKINAKYIDKTFEYIDKELIQYIDAADNMQTDFLENKIMPDFIKLYNPEWNEKISEDVAFINALGAADIFWDVYIKHALSEVEAIEIIIDKINNSKDCYVTFQKDMPYRKAVKLADNDKVKYLIFKSRREGYDIRTINSFEFKRELVNADSIREAREISKVHDLLYVDNHGKLCCTKTLKGAIQIIEYSEE